MPDNRAICLLIIIWGAIVASLEAVGLGGPLDWWLALALISFGIVGLTPWGRKHF